MAKKKASKKSDLRIRLGKKDREIINAKSGGEAAKFAKAIVLRACSKERRDDGEKKTRQDVEEPGSRNSCPGLEFFPKGSATEFIRWGNELDKQTDRGAAVLGTSFLEWSIRESIRSRLLVWDSQAERIFGSDDRGGELGFTDQCRMAYCLGLMGPVMLKDAEIIGKIRNRFAHHLGISSFQDQVISSLGKNLRTLDIYYEEVNKIGKTAIGQPPTEPRQRFVESVIVLHLLTYTAARFAGIKVPKEFVLKLIF